MGLGLAELGNKAELDQLGLELWLNWSLEDFPGGGGVGWGGGGGEKLGIKLKLRFSRALGCLTELRNKRHLENKINVPTQMFQMLNLF